MALYLYGQTALDVMRYLRATEGDAAFGTPERPRHLGDAVHTHRQLNELGPRAQALLEHAREPLHALVPKHNMNTRSTRLVTHTWSDEIPAGAYRNLDNGIYLPTPVFLLQQLATQVDELELICVGMELCGFYSSWSMAQTHKVRHTLDDEFDGCTFELEPAASVAKMQRFLSFQKGKRGYVAANHALKMVLDHSASPPETAVYLLLCLPRRLGGHGLPAPVLNVEVKVSTSTSTTSRFPDLYWPEHALDVEYDSDSAHSGNWSRYRDSRRIVELAAESVTVLPLTRAQLMNSDDFNAFATSVRRNLEIRARSLDANWHAKNLALRDRLLRGVL